MKKIYLIIAAAAILSSVASCNKAEIKEPNKEEVSATDSPIKVDISVSPLESDTKAVKQEWTTDDLINVWLDDTPENYDGKTSSPDFVLEYKGGKWVAKDAGISALTARLKESGGYIRGFYESVNKFTTPGNDWGMNKNWANFPREGNLIKTPVVAYFNKIYYTYDSKNKVFVAKINDWTFGTDFQLVVTGISLDDGYSLICDDILTMSGIRVVNGGNKSISVGEASDPTAVIAGVPNADGVAFVGKVQNGDKKQRTFTLVKKGDESTRYVFKTATAVEWNSNNGKRLVANKVSIDKFKAAVDLGLTSGTLWADHNVGDGLLGNYFAWGDPRVKDKYNKNSYLHWSTDHYGKYRNSDTVLNDADDAARQNWGAAWMTPSKAQWKELFDECDWTWDSETVYMEVGPIGGFNGYRVTSKKNGASIFLPAAGLQNDDSAKGFGISDVFTFGWYWANTNCLPGGGTNQTKMYADCVKFDSTTHELLGGNNVKDAPIYQGCSVRPVVVQ